MRKKKNFYTRWAACAAVRIDDPEGLRGRWAALTGGRPLALEIGCGKGAFIAAMAAAHPDVFFVGVERVPSVLLMAMERVSTVKPNNLRYISTSAEKLSSIFSACEVDRLYINFSDPWPEIRYHKRRLTHPRQLRVFDGLLAPGGIVYQKTDNADLFAFSLMSFAQMGWQWQTVCTDLHASSIPNIVTEYEAHFAALGKPIYYCAARKPGLLE
jgi:tRNA (guanine-N7-)-methyltransferase